MAHPHETVHAVRASYIQIGSLKQAATFNNVNYATARNWKRDAKLNGDDWDHARRANRLSANSVEDMTAALLEDFVILFQATMDAVKADEKLTPLEKTDAIAKLSDSYIKTVKAAGNSSPTLNKLSIAMDVIKDLGDFIRETEPKLLESFLEVIAGFGEEIVIKYGKKK